MNLITLIAMVAIVLCAWLIHTAIRRHKGIYFANAGESITPNGLGTKKTDAALTTRYLLVKSGTDVDHVAVCAAANQPLGVCIDEASAAEDIVGVQYLGGADSTVRMVANGVIALDALVYTAASGKIQSQPAGATVYRVGRALQAATADGHTIEVEPCFPLQVTFP